MTEQSKIISNNPFGLNVALPSKTIEEVKKVVKQEALNISANPFVDYLEQNDKVFSGEVAREIRKHQAQIYTLGQVMREGQPISTFSMNC